MLLDAPLIDRLRRSDGKHLIVHFDGLLTEQDQMLMWDAQTSGGLLLAVNSKRVDDFLAEMDAQNEPAWVVGEVLGGSGIEIVR